MKKNYTALIVLLLWVTLTALAWFLPAGEFSIAERRPLAQMPQIEAESVLDGEFMDEFEDYALDQFPLRDRFRQIKSLFCYYVLGQKDNNGIYLYQGYAAKQEYPLKEVSVSHALERFNYLYEKYLTDSAVYMAVVPDKGYYLAEPAGQLSMDYEKLFSMVAEGMPWATHIDLTGTLSLEDYYRTDTHWRQERLWNTAAAVCQAMGTPAPQEGDYGPVTLSRPFYGVYYGQAALPMEPDTLNLVSNAMLDSCTVYDYETGETSAVYNWDKLDSPDLYDVFLSGAKSLLTIENPQASTDRELIVFRDSFGSSLAPLLVQNYARVTLVDIRYVRIDLLDQFLDFHGQDVLMLYSTLVLNSSSTIR